MCVCVCVWSKGVSEGENDRVCRCEGVAGGIICRYGDQQVCYRGYRMCHAYVWQAFVSQKLILFYFANGNGYQSMISYIEE